jgi:glycosyltransferase involved in cell wall biosynthesis
LIVGRNPPKTLVTRVRKAWPGITFTGFVDDVRPYIKKSDVSVIPIRTGSGTRIKAFEAMAVGRPVVSTRVGMEGLEVTAGTHYLAADDPNGFADAILRLLDDECLRVRVASAARASLEVNLSWAVVARLAEEICLEILEGRRVARFDREAVV